jgi:hypothetical protein
MSYDATIGEGSVMVAKGYNLRSRAERPRVYLGGYVQICTDLGGTIFEGTVRQLRAKLDLATRVENVMQNLHDELEGEP